MKDTVFEALYDLAIKIKTTSYGGRITSHKELDIGYAVESLRKDLQMTVMPDESSEDHWGVVRIFAKNFVNRSYSPVSMEDIAEWIACAEGCANEYDLRIREFIKIISKSDLKRAEEVATAINNLVVSDAHFGPQGSCLDWIIDRMKYWKSKPCCDLDAREMLEDMRKIYDHPKKTFKGMGLALTANLFADLGVKAFAKPDLHVTPIISLVALIEAEPEAVFCAIIEIAKCEAKAINEEESFSWLHGGLYPRHLDRLIYLIGSDNHGLIGERQKSGAKERRRLMVDVLRSNGIISAKYADCGRIQERKRRKPSRA